MELCSSPHSRVYSVYTTLSSLVSEMMVHFLYFPTGVCQRNEHKMQCPFCLGASDKLRSSIAEAKKTRVCRFGVL
eukprot:3787283-Amphidinium_carterae.1